jgi:hypothetical protein
VEGDLNAAVQRDGPVRQTGPHSRGEQLDDADLPLSAPWMQLGLAAGGQQFPVQAEQLGLAWIIVFFEPVAQDEPVLLGCRLLHDGPQQSLPCVHASSGTWGSRHDGSP